jgi:hypothetical protein
MLRCKDYGLEKGSEIETEEEIDAAVERRRRIMGERGSVEYSLSANPALNMSS